jgi:CHASE3 domain sensor protein
MRCSLLSLGRCIILSLLLSTGCSKSPSESESNPTPDRSSRSASPPDSSQPLGQGLVEGAREAVKTVTQEAQKSAQKVEELAAKTTEQAQALLDQAKTMLGERRLQDAGGLLSQLEALTLTPQQQESFDQLKKGLHDLYGQVESGLANLKTMVTEKRYTDATALVSKLADFQLSPQHQSTLDDLKSQLQKLLSNQTSTEGAKTIGNLVPGR